MNDYKIFATSNSQLLGLEITQELKLELGELHSQKFSDGEVFVRYEESIRGRSIFIIAQVNMPYENLFELFMAIDAARRASAKEIIVVTPYLPHSRQERKDSERTSISSRVVADFLQQSGADRVMTIDLHTSSIEGFFKIPVDHLDTSNIFTKHIKNLNLENLCLCSPDFGGLKRIKKYKKQLDCEMAVIHKERLIPNQVASMEIIGEVKGKNVVIIDDMIDTAGTLCKAAELLIEKGALSVRAYCTHGLLSGQAVERIQESVMERVYIANTISYTGNCTKIESISCARIIAKAIDNLIHNKSIKEMNERFEF
jgi:ribose-phosphate pyrophosphokinase